MLSASIFLIYARCDLRAFCRPIRAGLLCFTHLLRTLSCVPYTAIPQLPINLIYARYDLRALLQYSCYRSSSLVLRTPPYPARRLTPAGPRPFSAPSLPPSDTLQAGVRMLDSQ